MTIKLIDPPSEEPITLTELKNHLRLDVSEDSTLFVIDIEPAEHSTGTITGDVVDVSTKQTTAVLTVGECLSGNSAVVKLQDSINGSTWVDVVDGVFETVDSSDWTQPIEYIGGKPYLKAVAVVTGAVTFGVQFVQSPYNSYEDNLLNGFIAAARMQAEAYQKRQLLSASYLMTLPRFCHYIPLMIHPVTEITSVKYYDSDNVQQTLDDESYVLDTDVSPAILRPVINYTWPITYCRPSAVEIEFVAGYESASDVPQATKTAICMGAGTLYNYRESETEVNLNTMKAFIALLDVDCWC